MKIEPALTAEKWERYLPALKFDTATRDLNIENAIHAVGSHAAAALALYGQPFGFSREDVTAIRLCVEICNVWITRADTVALWQKQ